MRFLPLVLLVACGGGDVQVGHFNTAPSATISDPPNGTAFDEGTSVTFEGHVGDDGGPEALTVRWSSDLVEGALDETAADGEGVVTFTTANLQPGIHAITLTAYDAEGASGSADIQVSIIDLPEAPEIAIVHPANGESAIEGEAFHFVAQVSDAQDAPEDLVGDVSSNVDGFLCDLVVDEVGTAACDAPLSGGDHTLTFGVTDTDGTTIHATVLFAVTPLTEIDNDADGFAESQGDCDDANDQIHPGANEAENGEDDDCDSITDEGTNAFDDDHDGFSENDGDCNDASPAISPVATEQCGDAVDNDCDASVDEAFATGCSIYYEDNDADTWGSSATTCLCSLSGPYTTRTGDCDDTSSQIDPGGTEVLNGLDDDCDLLTDEGTTAFDDDGDGFSEQGGDCNDTNPAISPLGTEGCGNGVDEDCDGLVDEAAATGCSTFYQDSDGDTWGSTITQCLCSAGSDYTAVRTGDCYDANGYANPSATGYQTTQRGDGSFDYNCDGSETKHDTAVYSCTFGFYICVGTTTDGWVGSAPACGTSGSWGTGCSAGFFSCGPASTQSKTQECL